MSVWSIFEYLGVSVLHQLGLQAEGEISYSLRKIMVTCKIGSGLKYVCVHLGEGMVWQSTAQCMEK